MMTFPSASHHVRHTPQGLGELRKSTVFLRGRNSTLLFWRKNSTNSLFSNPPNPPRTLPVHDVIQICWSNFSIRDFYFEISEWHPPPRAWTPDLMLHRTNLCAKQKVLSLTKPKGNTYKTKSLGHYITMVYAQCATTKQATFPH